MKKKAVVLGLLAMGLINWVGCASVQKKFTRKKKEPTHVAAAVYFETGPYQKKYSNAYYYKTHYTMWKSWSGDLVKGLGGNRKKTQRNAEETLNHLTQMSHYLTAEKRGQLEPLVEDTTKLVKKIEAGTYPNTENADMRVEFQKIMRLVDNDFYYDKVANQLLPDQVDLTQGPAAPRGTPTA